MYFIVGNSLEEFLNKIFNHLIDLDDLFDKFVDVLSKSIGKNFHTNKLVLAHETRFVDRGIEVSLERDFVHTFLTFEVKKKFTILVSDKVNECRIVLSINYEEFKSFLDTRSIIHIATTLWDGNVVEPIDLSTTLKYLENVLNKVVESDDKLLQLTYTFLTIFSNVTDIYVEINENLDVSKLRNFNLGSPTTFFSIKFKYGHNIISKNLTRTYQVMLRIDDDGHIINVNISNGQDNEIPKILSIALTDMVKLSIAIKTLMKLLM